MGIIKGLCRDNRKNGNYYLGFRVSGLGDFVGLSV